MAEPPGLIARKNVPAHRPAREENMLSPLVLPTSERPA
jgi:hypothetical protein